jgi:hypothetical protein
MSRNLGKQPRLPVLKAMSTVRTDGPAERHRPHAGLTRTSDDMTARAPGRAGG